MKINRDSLVLFGIIFIITVPVLFCIYKIITIPTPVGGAKNWSEPLAIEWFKSMDISYKGLKCMEYNSQYAKCSAKADKDIISFECYNEERHCNILVKDK